MAKKIDIGVDSKARKVKKIDIGVDNKARKVKKIWVGDTNGKARLCYNGAQNIYVGRTYSPTSIYNSGKASYSYDGLTFTATSITTAGNPPQFSLTRFAKNIYMPAYASSSSVEYYYTTDGTSYTKANSGWGINPVSIAYNNTDNRYYAFVPSITSTSNSGSGWSSTTSTHYIEIYYKISQESTTWTLLKKIKVGECTSGGSSSGGSSASMSFRSATVVGSTIVLGYFSESSYNGPSGSGGSSEFNIYTTSNDSATTTVTLAYTHGNGTVYGASSSALLSLQPYSTTGVMVSYIHTNNGYGFYYDLSASKAYVNTGTTYCCSNMVFYNNKLAYLTMYRDYNANLTGLYLSIAAPTGSSGVTTGNRYTYQLSGVVDSEANKHGFLTVANGRLYFSLFGMNKDGLGSGYFDGSNIVWTTNSVMEVFYMENEE